VEVHPAALTLNTDAGRDNRRRKKTDGLVVIRFIIFSFAYVVDQADPSWNLLLVELLRLSKIAEQSANDNNRESSGMAAPELGER
jgi:hypothetical protein